MTTQTNTALLIACENLKQDLEAAELANPIIKEMTTNLQRTQPLCSRDQERLFNALLNLCATINERRISSEQLLESLEAAIMCAGNYVQGQCKTIIDLVDRSVAAFTEIDTRIAA